MSKMDLDDDFDELDLNPEDLQLIVKEEELYLSSQMHMDNSHMQSSNIDMNAVPVQMNMSVLTPHFKADPTDIDKERTIEELRHKLYLAENDNKRLENRLRSSEESIRLKEHDLLQLKKKYAKYATDTVSTQPKRAFPGAPFPRIRTKLKRSPSSCFVKEESMSLVSRASTPSAQSQISPSDMDMRSQSVVPEVIPEVVPSSPLPPPPSQQQQLVQNKAEVLPKPKTIKKEVQGKNESNSELMMILFADIFNEWNMSQNNSKDFKSCLSPSRIKQFSDMLAARFIPAEGSCSSDSIQRLQLIAAEISDIIVRSVDAESTIRFLVIQFNACLSICIENSLYDIVQTIAVLVNGLTAYYDVIKDQFYKELLLDMEQSTIGKLVKCLSLYELSEKEGKGCQIISDYPDIASSNYTEIKQIAAKYITFPSVIAEALNAKMKSPPGAQKTVMAILDTLSRVGRHFRKPIFLFLLEDEGFLNLLSEGVPAHLLNKAWAILQTNFTDKDWGERFTMIKADNCAIIIHLTDLINMKQGSLTLKDWYLVRRRMLSILKEFHGVQLSENATIWIYKKIYSRTVDLMMELCEFCHIDKRAMEIRDHELLVKEGFSVIRNIIRSDCSKIFDGNTEYTTSKLADLVAYYLVQVIYEQHLARPILLEIEGILETLMES